MTQLRNFGIYHLPGIERGLYVVPVGRNTYFLYDSEYGTRLPPRFEVADNGHIINWFDDFPVWTVDDLIDSGKNYQK